MSKLNYWLESLESSFEEHGIKATKEQIDSVASDILTSHENIGMAFHIPENPLIGEIEKLEKELKREKSKVFCKECNGHGSITIQGPYHSSTSECYVCRGEGKHIPR